jgi:ribonuclease P protein component
VVAARAFPPAARLRSPADFAALRRDGKRITTRLFRTQYRLTGAAEARLGMAVSRRVSKRAVERNRIRRIIRDSFRLRRSQLPACDLLMIAQTAAAAQSGSQLRAELDLIWGRLAALKAHAPTPTMPAPG